MKKTMCVILDPSVSQKKKMILPENQGNQNSLLTKKRNECQFNNSSVPVRLSVRPSIHALILPNINPNSAQIISTLYITLRGAPASDYYNFPDRD